MHDLTASDQQTASLRAVRALSAAVVVAVAASMIGIVIIRPTAGGVLG